MPESIPIQPRPEPGWEEQQAKLQTCWWHNKLCPTAKVREPQWQPICWDGWVALLHATGTCSGECYYQTEPTEMKVKSCLDQRQS